MWKSNNLAGEFALVRFPAARYNNNKRLFADIYELGVIQHDEGSNYVSPEDFVKFELYYLSPTFWTWRRLGREKQYTADSLLDIIAGWFTE